VGSVAYGQPLPLDPTSSSSFRLFRLFERLLVWARIRFVIEMARLFFLGFYEDFRRFLVGLERELDRSETEAQYKLLWAIKAEASEKMDVLLDHLGPLEHYRYKGQGLVEYLIGAQRLQELRLFVKATKLEGEAEGLIDGTKVAFVTSLAQRQLTESQRIAMLEKYRELVEPLEPTP